MKPLYDFGSPVARAVTKDGVLTFYLQDGRAIIMGTFTRDGGFKPSGDALKAMQK